MGRLRRYTPGVKYHVAPGGEPRRCTATKRDCPFGSHFDSFEDAQERHTRVAATVRREDMIFFSTGINGPSGEEQPALRKASEGARQRFLETGRRPQAPLGVITTHLPGGQKITLERETYDLPGEEGVGARYKLRYFHSPDSYEQAVVNLNKPLEYSLLCKKLDEYYAEAADHAATKGLDPTFDYVTTYDQTMQAVTDVEVLSRGAGPLYKKLGLDVFSHDTPGTLTLRADYDASALQSYDVADALKAHSIMDEEEKEVVISINGSIPGGPPSAQWNLNRQADGKWYIGSLSDKFTSTKELQDAQDGAATLAFIFQKNGVDHPQASAKQEAFVQQMILEVEPKVKTYGETITLLRQERERKVRELVAGRPQQPQRESLGDKLSNLFS